MQFEVLTLFPEMFPGVVDSSILRRAQKSGLVGVDVHNVRDFAEGKHRVTDEPPYGGGAGMVMKPEPIDACLCKILDCSGPDARPRGRTRIILMSPQGSTFSQAKAAQLAADADTLILICGHYEGIDERVKQLWVDEELSIGDYVITGGELAALVVIDACSRMVPGVLGHEDSALNDSFMEGALDCPHFTRPPEFRGLPVPEVLLSGHHENIRKWRRLQSLVKTRQSRPDLFGMLSLSKEDRQLLARRDLDAGEAG